MEALGVALFAAVLALTAAPAAIACPWHVHRVAADNAGMTADSLGTRAQATTCKQHERGRRRPWYCRTTFDDSSRLWQKLIHRPDWRDADLGLGPGWNVWDAELIRADGAIETD
jgi:hypothetical protein